MLRPAPISVSARDFMADLRRSNALGFEQVHLNITRMSSELPAETISRVKAMQYLPDDGEEEDIVEAMLYLASPRARFVTGETLRVTGGYAAGI